MPKVLILRFDAPLMSFGGVSVDKHCITDKFPTKSMMTGFFSNALGWSYLDMSKHDDLQDRIRIASRIDREGRKIVDFQTVSLGQDHMRSSNAWTTRGRVEPRQGTSDSPDAIHIRYRHYIADAVYTLAVGLHEPEKEPTLRRLEEAMVRPERPLSIGRKCCIPSSPVLVDCIEVDSLRQALVDVPGIIKERAASLLVDACWPSATPVAQQGVLVKSVNDLKDWKTGVHCGERWVCFGQLRVKKRSKDYV